MKSTENTGYFADRLSDLISKAAQNGITLRDIEKVTGVKKESISKYQNNKAEPGLNSIVALAKYFNVSSDYLLGLSDAATTDITVQEICKKTGLSEDLIILLLEDYVIDSAEHQKNIYKLSAEGITTFDEERGISRFFLNTLYESEQFSLLCFHFFQVTRRIESAFDYLDKIAQEELYGAWPKEIKETDFIRYRLFEVEQIFLSALHKITRFDKLQKELEPIMREMIDKPDTHTKKYYELSVDDFLSEPQKKTNRMIADLLKGEDNGNSN